MDYGKLFSKAWNLVWENKFLIFLGMLVVIGGGIGNSGGSQGFSNGEGSFNLQNLPRFDFEFSNPFQGYGLPALAIVAILIVLAFVLVLWVIGLISRGGLIHGADRISKGQPANFSSSLGAGLEKSWRLIGIGLVPATPVILLTIGAFVSAGFYTGGRIVFQEGQMLNVSNILIFFPLIAVTCLLVLIALVLSLLRAFANRACMLEDLGVLASYRRGIEVFGSNLGPALVLFILQVVISIGIGLVLLLPGIFVALCCLLWPVLWIVQGTFAAFYSTLWTLAWNQWTDGKPDQLTR
jgi:hypothetical protein